MKGQLYRLPFLLNKKEMKHILLIVVFFALTIGSLLAQDHQKLNEKSDSISPYGIETRSSSFFKNKYLHNNFVHYIDNLSDNISYQAETTGDFQLPDLQFISINGNSYKWNKFYWNGFRTDSRLFAGTNLYNFDLYNHSFNIDLFNAAVQFTTDSSTPNSVAFRYNVGGLGGISPYTEELVNLYHPTALQRLFNANEYEQKILDNRRKMKGAGSVFLNFNLQSKGKKYLQQFYADFGTRMLVGFDFKGINNYYPEDFMKLEFKGELPFKIGQLFDQTYYLGNYSSRDNLFAELNLSSEESSKTRSNNISFFGKKKMGNIDYTSGITLSSNKLLHNDLNYTRNFIDQDGEAFEPWYPDAQVYEVSHAITFHKQLKNKFNVFFDGYNSLVSFNPLQNKFYNAVYAENVNLPYQSLYVYRWNSDKFTSGLLENTLRLNTQRQLTDKISFKAELNGTFDGMLLSNKTMMNVNWQGEFDFRYSPNDWFAIELNFSRKRVAYNFDHVKFFSNDYLNGDVYFWNDQNGDHQFQAEEQSEYFTSTGGKYHSVANRLKQQNYFTFDFPLVFTFGKHRFSMLNTYRKYNKQWYTSYAVDADQLGYTVFEGDKPIYFLNSGVVQYQVDEYPKSLLHSDTFYNFLMDAPFFLSSTLKYEYTSEKWYVSVAWSSFMMNGISAMGNGPLHNNVDVLSETTANPNNMYKLVGRLDQDRALAARILVSYQMNDRFKLTLSGKFKDGQPFTNFNTRLISNNSKDFQMAIWNNRPKGINPFDGEFGSRDDAFFNFEVRASYSGKIFENAFDLQLMVYNIYDFGTELVEFSFQPDQTTSRYAMEMNIPRGLMLTGKYYF
jgi:hypothetical protein